MDQIKKLYWASAIVSICGIIFEVLFGAVGSYILGDGVKQYSITIGLFLTGMGIGAYLSEKINDKLVQVFVIVEYLIGTIGGFSILILFGITAYVGDGVDAIFLYFVITVVGGLTGLEMPILIRKASELGSKLNKSTARVLFFDYIGSLIGTVAFVLLLRPYLEFVKTGFLIAIFNILIGIVITISFQKEIKSPKKLIFIGIFLLFILGLGFIFGNEIWFNFEQKLYRDPVVRAFETPYQRIIVTRQKDDIRLFIDGNIQFSSTDEYRYHEALVHLPMNVAKKRDNILILGGGDGLALREILKYDDVKRISIVDLDRELIEFSKTDPLIKKLNKGSLESEKVKFYYQDALKFLQENQENIYDVIIVDLPDPNNESLNKLYTRTFYTQLRNHLSPDGAISVQATSPLFAREVYWTISKTVEATGLKVLNYHVEIPSFGNWGFILAGREKPNIDKIKLNIETKYLSDDLIPSLFHFGKDEGDLPNLKINTLNHPILIDLYQKAWKNYY
ncbi:spermidine synthase [Vulcanibacillus modesticaldus]|uniref:Polyamine aminopropyltransferase n=1 Tax=Vulcanibacillus modesticaldus TaxID=337097 RepID=A0A1D2YUD2_9BACI|nr:polyamine aminopropyltransferase [Vulcanibacillus modesticaldus]OEF99314.1 spermidine synthase [Vulcanibacillus modesticaldus]